jgi:hypothetical protein
MVDKDQRKNIASGRYDWHKNHFKIFQGSTGERLAEIWSKTLHEIIEISDIHDHWHDNGARTK